MIQKIRLDQRHGVMHARMAGAKAATGHILVFLDSHVEVNHNWLPPILELVTEDYRTCACPIIDIIDPNTFAYKPNKVVREAFDWEFNNRYLPLTEISAQKPSDPFSSPIMTDGVFAMSAKYFSEIGGYDKGFDLWGGERFELSFKVWQCGGRIVIIPCSRVGQIRKIEPYKNPSYIAQVN